MDLLLDLISSFDPETPNFRPTEIYNENWLLKLVLYYASAIDEIDYPLGFLPGSTWYSEALLPTPFAAGYLGDKMAESRTNADGVIGHFTIGASGKADLELHPDARQFTVVEAKIRSGLSKGVKADPDYDQAARNVACMAETIRRANLQPAALGKFSFIILAPQREIDEGKFTRFMERDHIHSTVEQRVLGYGGSRDEWFERYFQPCTAQIQLVTICWESVLRWIGEHISGTIDSFQEFYATCIRFS